MSNMWLENFANITHPLALMAFSVSGGQTANVRDKSVQELVWGKVPKNKGKKTNKC